MISPPQNNNKSKQNYQAIKKKTYLRKSKLVNLEGETQQADKHGSQSQPGSDRSRPVLFWAQKIFHAQFTQRWHFQPFIFSDAWKVPAKEILGLERKVEKSLQDQRSPQHTNRDLVLGGWGVEVMRCVWSFGCTAWEERKRQAPFSSLLSCDSC